MALSDSELERYARHLILREVGGAGQQKLKSARVLVIGAGGLGAPVLLYLAAAGVGTLTIVDDDEVALSNLQRQVIHDTDRIGEPKTGSAATAIARLNPDVSVTTHAARLGPDNAMALIRGHDVIVDGSDNFPTRYLASDAAFFAGIPLVSAAVGRFDGQLTTLAPHLADKDGTPNPTYRCLYPEAPPEGTVPACEEAGILGVVPGILGTLQANEVLKLLLGIGTPLIGRLLMVDTLTAAFDTLCYRWSPENPLNGTGRRMTEADLGF